VDQWGCPRTSVNIYRFFDVSHRTMWGNHLVPSNDGVFLRCALLPPLLRIVLCRLKLAGPLRRLLREDRTKPYRPNPFLQYALNGWIWEHTLKNDSRHESYQTHRAFVLYHRLERHVPNRHHQRQILNPMKNLWIKI